MFSENRPEINSNRPTVGPGRVKKSTRGERYENKQGEDGIHVNGEYVGLQSKKLQSTIKIK